MINIFEQRQRWWGEWTHTQATSPFIHFNALFFQKSLLAIAKKNVNTIISFPTPAQTINSANIMKMYTRSGQLAKLVSGLSLLLLPRLTANKFQLCRIICWRFFIITFFGKVKKRAERLKTFRCCEITAIARICNKTFLVIFLVVRVDSISEMIIVMDPRSKTNYRWASSERVSWAISRISFNKQKKHLFHALMTQEKEGEGPESD